MITRILKAFLASMALKHGRLTGLYRKICQPDGAAWAQFLKRHGGFYAIGDRCSIQSNVTFTDPAYVRIGNNVRLSGCTVFGHDGSVSMLKVALNIPLDRVGKVDIRDNVFIGHQAVIMPNVTIGPNAIVAAGSIVTRDVPPGVVVAGVPAKQISTLDAHVKKLQDEMSRLPWRDHPHMTASFFGPADDALNKARVAHFFGGDRDSSASGHGIES